MAGALDGLPARLDEKLVARLFGASPRPSLLRGPRSVDSWIAVAASSEHSAAARCYAACQVDRPEVWARLYDDPAIGELDGFVRLCFAAHRVDRAAHPRFTIPERSHDDRLVEVERCLRRLAIARAGGLRVAWADVKRRHPQWEADPAVRGLFAAASRRGRAWCDPGELAAAGATGRFDVTGSDFCNPEVLRGQSTFGRDAPQLLLMLHTGPALDERIAADAEFARLLYFFQLAAALTFEDVARPPPGTRRAYPAVRSMVAWVRVDTGGIAGAWLVDEIQSLLVQHSEGWSSLFGRSPGFERRGCGEVDAFKARIREVFAGWEVSALATVLECARRNGVEHVYVRASTSVRGSSHSMRVTTARALYERLPRAFGFERVRHRDASRQEPYPLWHRRA